MSVKGTSVDYSERLKDMYISGPLNPLSGEIQNVKYAFGYPTKYIAGVQKLAQRYLISLVNTGVFEKLIGYNSSNILAVKNLFNEYNANVVETFRVYQNNQAKDSIPLDEQLDTALLLNAVSDGDTVSFTIKLMTKEGEQVTVLLPLPLT